MDPKVSLLCFISGFQLFIGESSLFISEFPHLSAEIVILSANQKSV
ncbi:hypothetical protein [Neobacillus novalis]|nr:hypothetical protein [Neobacillus novalis]